MAKKLYIGNIGPNADKATLKALFAMFGKVNEAYIVKDEARNPTATFVGHLPEPRLIPPTNITLSIKQAL